MDTIDKFMSDIKQQQKYFGVTKNFKKEETQEERLAFRNNSKVMIYSTLSKIKDMSLELKDFKISSELCGVII